MDKLRYIFGRYLQHIKYSPLIETKMFVFIPNDMASRMPVLPEAGGTAEVVQKGPHRLCQRKPQGGHASD
jgi:hypothetical protein